MRTGMNLVPSKEKTGHGVRLHFSCLSLAPVAGDPSRIPTFGRARSLMGLRTETPDRWYEVRIIVERSPGQVAGWPGWPGGLGANVNFWIPEDSRWFVVLGSSFRSKSCFTSFSSLVFGAMSQGKRANPAPIPSHPRMCQ